jgi:DNA polymerase-3 subunit epsilon
MPKILQNENPLVFVDVETTGTSAVSGRIIEIGIVKVLGDEVLAEYETLINPELRIDPFIEQMTGISYSQLENAPVFSQVKDEILELLVDSVFVAHNVRFDYGFIRNEFKRHGINFTSKHFDTIKLARHLYPGFTHYNLDAIMQRFNIVNPARHRAFGDAKVLWDFYKIAKKSFSRDVFDEALAFALKRPSLPPSISQETIDNLPEGPGVYIFYGDGATSGENSCLYIGKSVNIRDRVLSHFTNDYASASDMKIVQMIKSIETIETAGELSALLLESTLIKKHKPIFNKVLRESRKMLVLIKIADDKGFSTVGIKELEEIEVTEIENILAVFRNNKQLKDVLYQTCKEFTLCPKLMGLEKGNGRCFYSQIGQCNGACDGSEMSLKYNLRFDDAFFRKKVKSWKFPGPILIKEEGEKSQLHLIDKWCYLGSLNSEEDKMEDIDKAYRFDYDTYKILKRFLGNPNNRHAVVQLKNG